MQEMADRKTLVNVRFSERELLMLKEIMDATELGQSDILRQALRLAHAELVTAARGIAVRGPARPSPARPRPARHSKARRRDG
jgi:hypothetical protein